MSWVRRSGLWIMKLTTTTLDLVDSRAFPKGVTIQVYRPTGRPQYAT